MTLKIYFNFQHLLEAFSGIKSATIHRAALWILGEYANTLADITATMSKIHLGLGEVSFTSRGNISLISLNFFAILVTSS